MKKISTLFHVGIILFAGFGILLIMGLIFSTQSIAGRANDSLLMGWNGHGWRPVEIDESTRTVITTSYEHHEIHEGDHYSFSGVTEVGSGATCAYVLTTPNTAKYAHMVFQATGSVITDIEFLEGQTAVGTKSVSHNNDNRNSSNTSGCTIKEGSNVAGSALTGTVLWHMKSGAATNQSRAGTIGERSREQVLKPNTSYMWHFTSGTAANLTNLQLYWYMHEDEAK